MFHKHFLTNMLMWILISGLQR